MSNLYINTDAVENVAAHIKTLNGQMRDGLQNVSNAVNSLDNSWDGSASECAIRKFNEIKSKLEDNRYKVMDNYVLFLMQTIGKGYEQTEEVNKSLADAFK